MAIVDGGKSVEEIIKEPEYKEKDGKKYRVVLEEEDENSYINQFKKAFESGLKGDNIVLSTGFSKLDNFMSIRRKVYYAIGAGTGQGKTTFTDEAFVFSPVEWFLAQSNPKIDLKIVYWSLERSVEEKIARWISRLIFLKHQIIIAPDEILSWKWGSRLSEEKANLVRQYTSHIKEIFDRVLTIHAGSFNPQDIKSSIKEFADLRGKHEVVIVRKTDGYEYLKSVYVPNNPKEFIIIIVDPVNRISRKQFGKTMEKKEAMDLLSENLIAVRDKYGYTIVLTGQFNRSISNPLRLQSDRGVLPILDDFKETGNLNEDAQVVMAVFDPGSLKVDDAYGYDLTRLREGREGKLPGSQKYRSLTIIKNNYGPAQVGIGMAFQPQTGIFNSLPDPFKMTNKDYEDILSDEYFLKNKK